MAADRTPGLVSGLDGRKRCWWGASTEDYAAYHDREWGRPATDDQRLFEKICLEGFQAGLSWLTILRKRESFRRAFAGFRSGFLRDFANRHLGKGRGRGLPERSGGRLVDIDGCEFFVGHLEQMLESLTARLGDGTYAWRAGRIALPGSPGHLTYLTGIPRAS